MKIALVNPNHRGSLESKRAYIPLGLAYIAAVIRDAGRHEIKVIDAAALDMLPEELSRQLKNFDADIVAVGAVTEMFEDSLEVCRIAKKLKMISVMGGVHPTVLPNETIAFNEIDYIIVGEGERTLLELADALEKKSSLKKLKGIYFKEIKKGKTKIIKTRPREFIENLDDLPLPARDLFPWRLYSSYSTIVRRVPSMHMMTSRGCPFHCTFCASQSLWKSCRARNPKNIVDEIEHMIEKFGVREIYLFDDTFNLNLKRAEEICDEIIKRKIKISLRVQARVVPMTMGLLKKMKKAGCWCIYYGIESGNNEVLKDIKKGINTEQVVKTFKMTEKAGIRTFGFFMINHPTDNMKTIRDTENFALKVNPDFVNFSILIVYPGTEVYHLAVKEGTVDKIKPGEIFRPPRYTNKNISDEALKKELSKIYKKFYMRPEYMIRRLLRIRTFTEFKANIIAGLPFFRGKNPFVVGKKWVPIE